MNIKTGVNTSSINHTLIFPLASGDHLEENLKTIADRTGLSCDIMIREFKAESKENLVLFHPSSEQKIYLLGLGKKPQPIDFIKVFRSFFYQKRSVLKGVAGIDLEAGKLGYAAEFVINGILLASYKLGALKTNKEEKQDFFQGGEIEILAGKADESQVIKAVKEGEATAKTQLGLLALVDAPANYKTPQKMAEYAVQSGKDFGYDVKVFDEKACEEIGLHALLAVGKGSIENPPRFIVLEYKGSEDKPLIGLVGKGVTFDTGGVSLKPGDNMNYMKSDMGGAAAVFGTVELAARLKWPVHLIGVVPVTENCVDGLAIKPGDVIGSFAGKTIEVINTDAEGRLILADGLAYLKKNYEPEVMIDLATLTGNCIMALGYAASALLSNHDELAQQLLDAGQETGEKTWRMPLWDDYKDMMKSDVADIKNLSSAPLAGAITAAKFLETFIDGHPRWAHLDIAGVAFGDSEFGSMKSATAYGVRLLKSWIERNYL